MFYRGENILLSLCFYFKGDISIPPLVASNFDHQSSTVECRISSDAKSEISELMSSLQSRRAMAVNISLANFESQPPPRVRKTFYFYEETCTVADCESEESCQVGLKLAAKFSVRCSC